MSKLTTDQLAILKLLLSIEGIGPGKLRNLLAKYKTLEKIISADYNSLMQTNGISTNLAQRIRHSSKELTETQRTLEKELVKLKNMNGRIVTVWDPEFPPILKKIYDPPLMLYVLGEFHKEDEYSIAVVGTRQPTNYGKVQAEKITGSLASQGITIVSGLARGIDTVSHRTALSNNGRTIAVLGSGLDVIYPPENRKLFEDITNSGMIISEYPLGSKPDAANFPKRNRIIAGLTLGCIIVESKVEGGAMQTAALALDQNREVFAIPGNIGIKQSEGPNLLIQKGEAKLILNAEDVLVDLDLKLKPILGKNIPKQKIELNLFEEKILTSLNENNAHIDQIASATSLNTSDCLVHLLSLEFKGLVKQLPGKVFARI